MPAIVICSIFMYTWFTLYIHCILLRTYIVYCSGQASLTALPDLILKKREFIFYVTHFMSPYSISINVTYILYRCSLPLKIQIEHACCIYLFIHQCTSYQYSNIHLSVLPQLLYQCIPTSPASIVILKDRRVVVGVVVVAIIQHVSYVIVSKNAQIMHNTG